MLTPPTDRKSIDSLRKIMQDLLSPEGCPWDKSQTPQSIVPNMIEEAHEAAEAIESKNVENIKEELGDVLMQVIFQSAMAEKLGQFSFDDVVGAICQKLITRHPHVYGDKKASSADQALESWNSMKDKEAGKAKKGPFDFPKALPSLSRAHKIGNKTKDLNFDWQQPSEVLTKVDEELQELRLALKNQDRENIFEELGDLFFVIAQLARHLGFEAETAARAANNKFEERFLWMLEHAKSTGVDFKSIPLDEKERLWQQSKLHSPLG
ncbi:MAG: nucleoside triphosphate pyrophosphohydrolase [Oligoflexia bacterium]|nr:nucleoside triphosphate pyrophosphohydrolase [Oligoflexia bacterium]